MKIKRLLFAGITLGLSPFASAFTFNFQSFADGDPLPLSISVTGYAGSIDFSAVTGTPEIGVFSPPAGTKAVAFDVGEEILITFNGVAPTPGTVSAQYIDDNIGVDTFTPSVVDPNNFLVSFSSTDPNGRAGLQSVTFSTPTVPLPPTPIPEPTAALLGALGAALLVIRRKR